MTETGEHLGPWLDAFVDGELDPGAEARWQAHVQRCAACRAAVADRRALSAAVRAQAERFQAPDALAADLGAALAALGADAPAPPRRQWLAGPRLWLAMAASVVLAAVLSAAITAGVLRGRADDPVIDALVDGHVRAVMTGDLIAVASSDQHTVKPWFTGRVPLAPPVRDFAAEGFPLVGGRVDYVGGAPVAALVYRRNKHVIDLFVGAATPDQAAGPVRTERHGYTVIRWRDQDLSFAAVSDAEGSEIEALVKLVRAP